jgi:hypothetical protein
MPIRHQAVALRMSTSSISVGIRRPERPSGIHAAFEALVVDDLLTLPVVIYGEFSWGR